ncbi:hypothetical protein L596_002882 [Steinernema carpocapsae]|uniref:Uncharacterized protein n=1 Tax=Steinernema carpocapsae TaxID=34508 RepID=A0A4U8UUM3_STECR|nr:hypothetical protein L596_002882 [Steinernema carpocapsae]
MQQPPKFKVSFNTEQDCDHHLLHIWSSLLYAIRVKKRRQRDARETLFAAVSIAACSIHTLQIFLLDVRTIGTNKLNVA